MASDYWFLATPEESGIDGRWAARAIIEVLFTAGYHLPRLPAGYRRPAPPQVGRRRCEWCGRGLRHDEEKRCQRCEEEFQRKFGLAHSGIVSRDEAIVGGLWIKRNYAKADAPRDTLMLQCVICGNLTKVEDMVLRRCRACNKAVFAHQKAGYGPQDAHDIVVAYEQAGYASADVLEAVMGYQRIGYEARAAVDAVWGQLLGRESA